MPRLCSQPRMGGKYGAKQYWDGMYSGSGEAAQDGLPADRFSWYCGWRELEPFWNELVSCSARVLVPGVGNDATVADLYDAGWTNIEAFDYSAAAVAAAGRSMPVHARAGLTRQPCACAPRVWRPRSASRCPSRGSCLVHTRVHASRVLSPPGARSR